MTACGRSSWLLLFLSLAMFGARSALAAVQKFELTITLGTLNPDCYNESYPGLLINDQHFGPTIKVFKDDDVEVKVNNHIDPSYNLSTSIHFHGIRQYGTVESDGVPGITQDAILPGQSYVYRFRVKEQVGTFFYHAHVGLQDDTVQGALIVYDNKESVPGNAEFAVEGGFRYHDERILHLSEWWHQDFMEREMYYMGPDYKFDKGADSILINGMSVHQSILENPKNFQTCAGYSAINVMPNRIYRLRVIGGMTLRTLGLAIAHHSMTIIEADGEFVKPYETDFLEVGPGQRFSVLITTSKKPAGTLSAIATTYRYRHQAAGFTENGFGYLRYDEEEDETSVVRRLVLPKPEEASKILNKLHIKEYTGVDDLPVVPEEAVPNWIYADLEPMAPRRTDILDVEPDRVIKLRSSSKKIGNITRYTINGRQMSEGSPFVLKRVQENTNASSLMALESDGFNPRHETFPIKHGEIVDLVFQNVKSGRECLIHPWHTHGHSHYMIATGEGEYNHTVDKHIRNFPNPLYKDVSMVYPTEGDDGCGWTKVRILADNPGTWIIHCHITAHMMQGKFAIIEESPELIPQFRLYK